MVMLGTQLTGQLPFSKVITSYSLPLSVNSIFLPSVLLVHSVIFSVFPFS
jgi:hypothetical protein